MVLLLSGIIAAALLLVLGLAVVVLVWHWRTDHATPAPEPTPPVSSWNNGPVAHATISPDNPSVISWLADMISPDLSSLLELSRISSSIQWKTADGQPLSQEDQMAAMQRAINQLEAEKPDSPLVIQLRAALEPKADRSGVKTSYDGKAFRLEE